MNAIVSLDQLSIGQTGIIESLDVCGAIRRRMLDLGFLENTPVQMVCQSPSRDPSAYLVRGTVIALRQTDATQIQVSLANQTKQAVKEEKPWG
ncbi:MAG: FeoA family protein [Oscillospiraceae bacterium]